MPEAVGYYGAMQPDEPLESREQKNPADQADARLDDGDPTVGRRLLALMASSQTWVHRRVESLRLDAEGQTRWHVSVDMTLPEDNAIAAGRGQVVVPIAFMNKGTLRRLDVEYGGKSVTVLGKKLNSEYALAMLAAAIPPELPLDDGQRAAALEVLQRVVECSTVQAGQAVEAFDEWYAQARRAAGMDNKLADDQDEFGPFVRSLSQHFLFLVVLDEEVESKRVLLKYSWDHEPPNVTDKGKKCVSFSHELADFGFAASHHVEVEVPHGLAVRSLEVAEFYPDGFTSLPVQDVPEHTRSVAHAAIAPSHRFARGGFKVKVEPVKAGIFAFTRVAVLAVVACVVLAQFIRAFDSFFLLDVRWIPSPSSSIILVGPALLVSWMSRRTEHSLLTVLLKPLRKALLYCSIALLLMAALAAIPFTPAIWWILWFIVMFFACWAALTYAKFSKKRADTLDSKKS